MTLFLYMISPLIVWVDSILSCAIGLNHWNKIQANIIEFDQHYALR